MVLKVSERAKGIVLQIETQEQSLLFCPKHC